jgi:hypothetical protein
MPATTPDERERLVIAATVKALDAIEQAGIALVTEQMFGELRPSPSSFN